MSKKGVIGLIIIVIIIVLVFWWVYDQGPSSTTTSIYTTSTTTGAPSSTTPTTPNFDQSLTDGTITVMYPSADFALATSDQQVLTQSNIPPCDQSFNYCLYYIGSAYLGTNIESAGIRIQRRPSLATQNQCLNTQPSGFTGLTPVVATSSNYGTSVFQVGGGTAGGMASGNLYRLEYQGTCYEIETRSAQSDYGNYPSSTMQQFTPDEQNAIAGEIQAILATLSVSSGTMQIALPQPHLSM